MPSVVYQRRLPATYRGYPRLRQESNGDGGSQAVCAVPCDDCGTTYEVTANAIRLAEREKRGHRCRQCNVRRTLRIRKFDARDARGSGK